MQRDDRLVAALELTEGPSAEAELLHEPAQGCFVHATVHVDPQELSVGEVEREDGLRVEPLVFAIGVEQARAHAVGGFRRHCRTIGDRGLQPRGREAASLYDDGSRLEPPT